MDLISANDLKRNLFRQARYFHNVMDILLEIIIGFELILVHHISINFRWIAIYLQDNVG
jgi:hypothetical protein